MEWYEIIDYDQAKNFIATSIKDIARSFVKIGYYLKYIKEKELYKEDGYQDIWEFAFDTYGISRSTASRYIAINDRFSEHGNSPVLAAAYQDYSKCKLQEMLYLTDEQIENVTPEMTVKEIREIRKKPTEYAQQCIESFAKYLIEKLNDWFLEDFDNRVSDVISAEKSLKEYLLLGRSCWEFKNQNRELCRIRLFEDYIQLWLCWGSPSPFGEYEWFYLTSSIKNMWNVVSLEKSQAKETELAKCITGKSSSGFCEAAAYCDEPVQCCAACKKDCNIRCGWLEECATSHKNIVANETMCVTVKEEVSSEYSEELSHEEIIPAEIEGQVKISDYEGIIPEGMTIVCKEREKEEITPQSVLKEETEKLNEWLSAFEGEEHPSFVIRQKIIVDALNKTVITQSEQPEFPILKNNEQRKQWLNNYKEWGLWYEDSNTGASFYKYDFENGARLIAETYKHRNDYARTEYMGTEFEFCYFHLVGGPEPPRTKYGCGKWTRHETYNRNADNITELVEFLKAVQKGENYEG